MTMTTMVANQQQNIKQQRKIKTSMKVSVIQMQCNDFGDKNANMATFRRLVEQAVVVDDESSLIIQNDNNNDNNNDHNVEQQQQQHLILGPECAICGYSYDYECMWKTAEPQGGPTESFLCELSKRHQIYVGVSYLEAREVVDASTATEGTQKEAHFFNTFCLAGPDGTIKGRISKATPCSVEAYLFKGGEQPSSFLIECDGYRFGVLICYENFIYDSIKKLQDTIMTTTTTTPIDLVLQPFSGPLADDEKPYVKEALRELYLKACPDTAKYLQCPALYCNKVGKWKQPSPSTALPMSFDTEFPGNSAICDASGNELGRLGSEEESVLTKIVELGSSSGTTNAAAMVGDGHGTGGTRRSTLPEIPRYWGGFTDGTPFLKICCIYEWLGSRSYQNDDLRKRLAREALNNTAS